MGCVYSWDICMTTPVPLSTGLSSADTSKSYSEETKDNTKKPRMEMNCTFVYGAISDYFEDHEAPHTITFEKSLDDLQNEFPTKNTAFIQRAKPIFKDTKKSVSIYFYLILLYCRNILYYLRNIHTYQFWESEINKHWQPTFEMLVDKLWRGKDCAAPSKANIEIGGKFAMGTLPHTIYYAIKSVDSSVVCKQIEEFNDDNEFPKTVYLQKNQLDHVDFFLAEMKSIYNDIKQRKHDVGYV